MDDRGAHTALAFVVPRTDPPVRERQAALRAALEAAGFAVAEVEVGAGAQTAEQAVFTLANELRPSDVIVLLDTRSATYDYVDLAARCRDSFPAARLVLLTERAVTTPATVFAGAPALDALVAAAAAEVLTRLRAGAEVPDDARLTPNARAAQTHTPLDEVVPRYVRRDVGAEFSDVRLDTPVAPKALAAEATVAAVLARPRTRGRVLLVIPSQFNVYGMRIKPAYPALGVMWVAAMLEQAGHACEIIDQDADEADLDAILQRLADGRFDILGLTAVTPTYPNAVQIARAAKARCPQLPVILGGIHATVDPLACAREEAFDFIAVGEAEITAVELVDAILAGTGAYAGIRGILYRDAAGEVVATGARALAPDLDAYPYPAVHLIRSLRNYAPPDAVQPPAAPIMVSRGCPGQCTYCETKNIFGRRTRFRSPENVIGEIRRLVTEYGVREIHFLDDVITANKKFVRAFCDLLKREPYRLHLQVSNGLRADMVNAEILTALKEVGLRNVGFGIESGNERVLQIIKKGITKDQVRTAVQTAKAVGLETWGFFLFGLPGDTEESIRDTVDFAIELDVKYAKFAILKPFPGSEAYYQLDEKGLVDSRDYSLYGVYTPPVHHLATLPAERIFALQQQAVRRFYLRPRKLLEHLSDIRSFGKFVSFVRGGFFVLGQLRAKAQHRLPPNPFAPRRTSTQVTTES